VANPEESQKRETVMEKCKSVCGENHCELPDGHKGKHHEQGCTWTDGGAKRVNAELKAANNGKEKEAI
jgi:hypothetical protein